MQGSAPLLKKCDGLPLALASVAKQLNSENEPTGQFCAELCRDLGYYLEREGEEEPNFARLEVCLWIIIPLCQITLLGPVCYI